jgi:hypothetical protein
MEYFVIQANNIDRFHQLLASEHDSEKRRTLAKLLAEEEARRDRMLAESGFRSSHFDMPHMAACIISGLLPT